MLINGNQIRPGNVLKHRDKLWVVVKIAHTQPGKGGAYTQAELKEIIEGTKLNERFRSDERVERVRLDQKDHQLLYREDGVVHFMDTDSYEQIAIPEERIGDDRLPYLRDGMTVTIESHEGSPITVSLPETMEFAVAETEAVVKGQTAASSNKPAILENGVRVMVPPFIEIGDVLTIKPEDSSYVERVKKAG